jgi:two-component system LytT family response regulator
MLKALITSLESDADQLDIIDCNMLITWFEISNYSKEIDSIKQWTNHNPLLSLYDSNLEILKYDDQYVILNLQSVVRIENNSKESYIHLENNTFIATSIPLDLFEDILGEYKFFRVHQDHLINLQHINSIVQCSAFITLSNSNAVPVGVEDSQKIIDFLSSQTII